MARFVLTPAARADLAEIFDYISKNSDASRAAEAEDLAADVRFRDEPAAAPKPMQEKE